MKKSIYAIMGILVLAASLSSCAVKKTDVTFELQKYYLTDVDGRKYDLKEARILGDFNDWAGSTTDADTTWTNADPLTYVPADDAFEVTESFKSGTRILYTLMATYTYTDGSGVLQTTSPGWMDPFYLHNSSGHYFISPYTEFVDNGMGDGGHNAAYDVP